MGDSVLMQVGVMVGRFNPIHLGHQRTIDKMLFNHTLAHSLVFIGSANASLSLRNLFSYKERKGFIQDIYPELKVLPIADQDSDEDWFESLIDMVDVAFPFFHHVHLYCGDLIDVANFPHNDKITIKVIDRYEEQVYSATEVRQLIMQNNPRALRELLDHRIHFNVISRGRARMLAMLKGER
jgi:nicotinamide mononucleotide adenylyltransferase